MKLRVEEHGKVVIISPEGDVKIGEGDVALRDAFKEQIEAGKRHFVLDLREVRYFDSAGLGELVATLKRVKEAEGEMRICNVNQRVNDAFHVTQLVRVLDIDRSREDAIASFL
jgi:anti-sigma B factor antagonist